MPCTDRGPPIQWRGIHALVRLTACFLRLGLDYRNVTAVWKARDALRRAALRLGVLFREEAFVFYLRLDTQISERRGLQP